MEDLDFKTSTAVSYYYHETKSCKITKTKHTKFIDKDYTEEELTDLIKNKWSLSKYLYKYIVTKQPSVVDKFSDDELFMENIKESICTYTNNIDLYKKYCSVDFDHTHGFILSLSYKSKPSKLTKWIKLNCQICNLDQFYPLHKYFVDANDQDKFDLILYVIKTLHFTSFNITKFSKLFIMLGETNFIKIIEALDDNNLNLLRIFITYCSVPSAKLFIETNNIDADALIKTLGYIKNYDMFMYIICIVDLSKIKSDYFDFYFFEKLHNNYDIMLWLCTNGFVLKPRIINIYDDRIIMLVINNVIVTGDYSYINNNIKYIMIKLINRYEELFNLIPMNLLDTNIIFQVAIFYEKYELIQLLINNGYKLDNMQDIMHDLKLLQKDQMATYISDCVEIFN